MTSEEIKANIDAEMHAARDAKYQDVIEHTRNVALLEIAYQLAVMNEQLRPILNVCLTPKVIITEPRGGANL